MIRKKQFHSPIAQNMALKSISESTLRHSKRLGIEMGFHGSSMKEAGSPLTPLYYL